MEQTEIKGPKNNLRVTPEDIGELEKNQVFVFGANEAGIHGAGAALYASKRFGAHLGLGFGFAGTSFAIPTKDWEVIPLPLKVIEFYVKRFITFTNGHYHKKWNFMVTKVGCGLAGFTPEQIAPMFKDCRNQKNIWLPQDFHDVLDGTYVAPKVTFTPVIIDHSKDTKITL
jgi:hypothetical protein